MDVNLIPSATPLSKIPSTGMYTDLQAQIRASRQEQEETVRQVAQITNSQKEELEGSVSKNEQKKAVQSTGLYTQARQLQSQQEQQFMSKIDLFA